MTDKLANSNITDGTISGAKITPGTLSTDGVDLVTTAVPVRIENRATAPGAPTPGRVYYDTTAGALFYSDGTAFNRLVRKLPSTLFQTLNGEASGLLSGADFACAIRTFSFTKQSASTSIKITYCDSLSMSSSDSNATVAVVVQVDGTDQIENWIAAPPNVVPLTVFGVVSGLGAGSHTLGVRLRLRGGANGVTSAAFLGSGAKTTILVEEIDP